MGVQQMEALGDSDQQFLAANAEEMEEIKEHSKLESSTTPVSWLSVFRFSLMHIAGLVGLYYIIFLADYRTLLWTAFYWISSFLGITGGAHRLWSHRSYKANAIARTVIMIFNTMAFQNDIIEWARDHRCHHKWTDTNADPHNTTRGFFFSHMGWLLVRKHPELRRKGATLDLSDLFNDKVLMFQRKYYPLLVIILCFLLPTAVPVYFWKESVAVAFFVSMFRYVGTLHFTFLINSAAHKFGFKPYDSGITAVDSFWLSVIALGEGGHNFHHTFPQDYRTSEYSGIYNVTKHFIDLLAYIGWVSNRKVVSSETVERQKSRNRTKIMG